MITEKQIEKCLGLLHHTVWHGCFQLQSNVTQKDNQPYGSTI